MKIGIIGTRGIPNEYGGFEQFAEDFSVRMAERGHELTVYTSHRHPFKDRSYKGVRLIRCFDPEYLIGTAGQFIYDFNCIRDARIRDFDIILQLGYTSSTVWSWAFPRQPLLVTNMDGLEWKRSKYSSKVQRFLRHAERWGVRYSDHLIADSEGIRTYLRESYGAEAFYVAYGATIDAPDPATDITAEYGLQPGSYDLLIARFEPENNIATVLEAYTQQSPRKLVLVGRHEATAFGRRLQQQYAGQQHIVFAGGIYRKDKLNALRRGAALYHHGHSVGGTNPSLLEAMACGAVICAHDNEFNRSVLKEHAFYFNDAADVRRCVEQFTGKAAYKAWTDANFRAIETEYNWEHITDKLEAQFATWLNG